MLKLRFTVLTRVILLAILAGSTMLSCTRRHKVIDYEEIQLGTTSVGTKALVTSKQSLIDLSVDNRTGFGVYGYKTISTKNYTYRQFNNTIVTPSGKTSTTWSYSPKRYWDKDDRASYQFAAYWPYFDGTGATTVSEQDKVLSINGIPNWQKDTENSINDILVATKRGSHSVGGELAGNTVYFNFEHILANVFVRAYYVGIEANHVNILSMQLSGGNMLTTNGSADYQISFGGQENPIKGFGTIATGDGSHTLLSQTDDAPVTLSETTFCDETLQNPQYGYQPVCSWFVVPSTGWQSLTLNVKYSLGDINQTPAPTEIAATPVTNIALNTPVDENTTLNGTTLPKYRYIITLKFNSASNGIEVESIKVADWKDVYIETGVYNW